MKKTICIILTMALLFGNLSSAETVAARTVGEDVTVITASVQSDTLKAAAKKPHLNYTQKTLKAGKSLSLKLVGATAKSWKSSNKKVAGVSGKGKVTAKTPGKATITCKAKNGKKYTCKITVKKSNTPSIEDQVYAKIIAMKKKYPEGMKWTNDNYYAWKGGIYSGGYGCAGFAFMLSDAAFGDLPARTHTDFSKIRVGDILRIDYNAHSVIVLEVKDDSVIVAEGNYNSSVHWGRQISFSYIEKTGIYVMTRYAE